MLCDEELELLSQVPRQRPGGIRVRFVENPRQEAGKHCIQFPNIPREDGTRIPIRVEKIPAVGENQVPTVRSAGGLLSTIGREAPEGVWRERRQASVSQPTQLREYFRHLPA